MPLSTGQILNNRYRIVKLLGQGGFGAVYRAWDTVLERPCALKESLETAQEAERQFKREAKMLANLAHPNLPRVTDYFSVPGQGQYLVMDFVEGRDLQEILDERGGPLPEEQALSWMDQVCQALTYLHEQAPPIIHRDVKPANIKITPQGKAMLVDFGIAKLYDPRLRTTVGARAVTPGYSPQEQYGQGATDVRTDVYALGATFYALLTGRQPPESIQRSLGAPLPSPRQFNPAVSGRTEQAVMKAMESLPENRWQSAEHFRAAFSLMPSVSRPQPPVYQRMAAGGATASTPSPAVAPTWQVSAAPAKRALPWGWLGLVGALGLIVVVLVAMVIVFVLGGGKDAVAVTPTTEAMAVLPSETSAPQPINTPVTLLPTTPWRTNTPVTLRPTTPAPAPPTTKSPSVRITLSITFTDQRGVKMKLISAGEFEMGSQSGKSDERPVHTVYLDAFYIDLTEVTNSMYASCVKAGACTEPSSKKSYTRESYYGNPTYDDYPVIVVSWEQARKYCEWRGGRLPTEAEWEKAARGNLEGKLYTWGDQEPDCSQANFGECKGDTAKVGSYPPNGFGLFDMAGNVWEWVMDWHSENYYASSPSENPTGPPSGEYRVLRGGSWYYDDSYLRVVARTWDDPTVTIGTVGFRCVR